MSEWISVKDRLPKPYTEVLTYRKLLSENRGFITLDHLIIAPNNESLMWGNDLYTWKSRATHWMPLPEPPKGD